jgi:hypothetical protein
MKGLSGSNSAVECDLAKVEVAGSNPVSRSRICAGRRNADLLLSTCFRTCFRSSNAAMNLPCAIFAMAVEVGVSVDHLRVTPSNQRIADLPQYSECVGKLQHHRFVVGLGARADVLHRIAILRYQTLHATETVDCAQRGPELVLTPRALLPEPVLDVST